MGGPRTVKTIFTSQPSDLSNYSLFLRVTEEITSTWRKRGDFSVAPCAFAFNQWIFFPHLFGSTNAFSVSTCLTVKHPLLKALNTNTECMWHTCVSTYGSISACATQCVFLWLEFGGVRCNLGGLAAPLSGWCQPVCLYASFLCAHSPQSNIYLLPWQTLSRHFCLSVSELGSLYC